MEKRKRGSGDKTNVGRPKTPYDVKVLYIRGVPPILHDLCRSLVDAEVLKWKLKNKY